MASSSPHPSTNSPPTWLSRTGAFLNGVGNAFSGGWKNITSGNFKAMDVWQWGAMAVTGVVLYAVVAEVLETLWNAVKDFLPYIMAGLALLGVLALFSHFSKGDKPEKHASAPEDAADKTALLDTPPAPTRLHDLVMSQVGTTKLAVLDAATAARLNLNDVTLNRDALPKPASEASVTDQARKALQLLG